MNADVSVDKEFSNFNVAETLRHAYKSAPESRTQISQALVLRIEAELVPVLKQNFYSVANLSVSEVPFD